MQRLARRAQCQHFGMGGGIAIGLHAIDACGDDLAALDDHGAERASALFDIVEGEPYGLIEICAVVAHFAPAFSSMVTIGAKPRLRAC